MEKVALHLSHNLGRSGGYRKYHRKRASCYSCAPSSVPLTVDGCTVNHAPVFISRRNQRATWTGEPANVSASASYYRNKFLFLAYPLPSIM